MKLSKYMVSCFAISEIFANFADTPMQVHSRYSIHVKVLCLQSLAIMLMSLMPLCVWAGDDVHVWDAYFSDIIGLEEYDESEVEAVYEHLCELEASPLNINTAEMSDFIDIPGITMEQISDIIEYRDRYGDLKTIEELGMVKSIGHDLRLYLSCFFTAAPKAMKPWFVGSELKKSLKYAHGTVTATLDVPLYTRDGYLPKGDAGEPAYLGDKYKYSVKYVGSIGENVKYGLLGSKDAGEPLFAHGNAMGMDFYSFYVNIKNIKRLKSLMLGRYRVRFGMGLVQNGNLSFGKQSMLTGIGRTGNSVIGHTSRSDANYFQGAAATVDIGKTDVKDRVELTAFYSYRKVDATLNKDDGTVSTILTTGYHRTQTEMDKKNNTTAIASGAHLAWQRDRWHAGISAVYDWFDRTLNPSFSTEGYKYRQYNARGNSFWNVSADYGYVSSAFSFSGETATGDRGALATLNAMQAKLAETLSLVAVQRFYSYRYHALYANAFSDGGKVHNESGVYLGAQWNAARYLQITAYSDVAYSPWLKYQVHASSYSLDNSISATYSRRAWTILARYRLRSRQYDNADKTALFWRDEHRARLSATYAGNGWTWRTQLDANMVMLENSDSRGYMIMESATFKPANVISLSANVGYFDTDDYNSRIYIYEKSVLNAFSIPQFYGNGVRMALMARCDIGRWMVAAKVGYTHYFDRNTIGTAQQQIHASHQTDVNLQLRYRF